MLYLENLWLLHFPTSPQRVLLIKKKLIEIESLSLNFATGISMCSLRSFVLCALNVSL